MEKNNVNHLFYTDKNYPSNLKLCTDSPINLFYKGSINWNNQRFISIVGTRKSTQFGKRNKRYEEETRIYTSLICHTTRQYFHRIGPLGRFDLVVAMSVCLSV